jgi:hypothetical protein
VPTNLRLKEREVSELAESFLDKYRATWDFNPMLLSVRPDSVEDGQWVVIFDRYCGPDSSIDPPLIVMVNDTTKNCAFFETL